MVQASDSLMMPAWDGREVLLPLKELRKKTPVAIALYSSEEFKAFLAVGAGSPGQGAGLILLDVSFLKG